MVADIIPQNLPKSQSPSIKLDTVQKLPSSGFIKVDLKEAWAEFIKRFEPYTWFVTLTFKEARHPESADKAFKRWIRFINECLYGRRYRDKKKGVTWIKCMEYQKRDVIHFHCLLADPYLYQLKRMTFEQAWEQDCQGKEGLINGYAKVKLYDARGGAVNYCSKYVMKGGEIDLYVSPERLHLLHDQEPTLKFIN